MTTPVRLQLSRKPGFNLQALSLAANGLPAVKVDRGTAFGNPFVIGEPVDRKQAKRWGWWPLGFPDFVATDAEVSVRRFRAVLLSDEAIHVHVQTQLRGKNLACWCKPGSPCHAAVLLALANRPTCDEVKP